MKRKSFLLFTVGTLLCSNLIGCSDFFTFISNDNSGSENDNFSIDNTDLTAIYEQIVSQLPSETSKDIELPKINVDNCSVSYTGDFVVEDGKAIVEFKEEDYLLDIEITVSLGKKTYSDTFQIKIINANKSVYEYLNGVFDDFELSLPNFVNDNYKIQLPSVDATYESKFEVISSHKINKISNSQIEYVYERPKENEVFLFSLEYINKDNRAKLKKNFSIKVLKYDELNVIPKMYIDTNNREINSKDNYVSGNISIDEPTGSNTFTRTLKEAPMDIKGRGNSTWSLPKKPYKIKFKEKQSLFGEPSFKDWVLLANYCDQTLIRNYLAYTIGGKLRGFDWTPCCHFVDVYLNNVYQGNYMLTDQVEVKKNRVNITQDSSETDTGYLIEIDSRLPEENASNEGKTWFNISFNDAKETRKRKSVPFGIKYPKTDSEYFNNAQLQFIKNYVTQTIDALNKNNNWLDYIDLDSAVDFFLVEDLFKNVDSGYASVFLYKDKGTKLFFGPLWDFDLSSLNQGHLDATNRSYPGWYTSLWEKNAFFYYLMQRAEFKDALKKRWNGIYPTLNNDINKMIDDIVTKISDSRIRNFQKWDVIGTNRDWYTSDEVYNAKTYDAQIQLLKGWFKDRIGWMEKEIAKF